MRRLIVAALVCFPAAWAQQGPGAGTGVQGPLVRVEGTVARVQAEPGLGTPYLDVARPDGTTRVWLGSIRYLVHHNFNPKAGETVRVEGFRQGERELLAKEVTLPDQDKSLDLRDDAGKPLWQRGRYGRRQAPLYRGPEEEKP
jgi:hypothetical protein